MLSSNVLQSTQVHNLPKLLIVSLMAALIGCLSFATSSTASAEAQVNVTPYENLSTTSPTTVTVSASGLTPNVEVAVMQVEINYVETPEFTGDRVEQAYKATIMTSPQGSFSVQIPVQYDVRPDLAAANFCQNDYILRRLCYLNVRYQTEESLEIIAQTKLYFGVFGPVEDPTPLTTPVSKDECFKDGWRAFGDMFDNQGKCVAFVSGNGRSTR